MTKDEASLVAEQTKVHQAAISLVDVLLAKAVDSYAGSRVDPGPNRRGQVTIYAAGKTEAIESVASTILGKGVAFRVLSVEHSQQELLALAANLKDALTTASVNGTTGVDDDRNAVVVAVADRSGPLPKAIDLGVASGLAVVDRVPGTLQPVGLYKNQPIAYQLVEGGQHISISATRSTMDIDGIDCSSGWAVQNSVGTYILTAGHCLGSGGSQNCTGWSPTFIWFQGGSALGNSANCATSLDAGVISTTGTRNNWGRVHDNWSNYASTVIQSSGNVINGLPMCNTGARSTGESGYSSPKKCGVVTQANISGTTPGSGSNFFQVDFYICQGDSGAGVYRDTPTSRVAEGIVSSAFVTSQCSNSP